LIYLLDLRIGEREGLICGDVMPASPSNAQSGSPDVGQPCSP